MSGLQSHNKVQANFTRYIKELDKSLIQTSPRLSNRSYYSIHKRNETFRDNLSKISIISHTPEPFKGLKKTDIRKALDSIKKPENQLSIKTPFEKPQSFKIFTREDPVFKHFTNSIFCSEPSIYKKFSVNSDIDNIDVVSADKILIEARKIIKSGIRKKKISDQSQDDVEYFWTKYISKEKVVRWDIFEENFITFIKSYMVTDLGAIRKVNWRKLLHKIFSKYCKDQVVIGNWQQSPCYDRKNEIAYKTFSSKDLCACYYSQDLVRFLAGSEDELLPEPIRHKTDKEYFYSCGCVYKGQWKEGRRDGSGLLKLCSKEKYEGYFTKGLFHSYGILTFQDFDFKGFFRKDYFHGYGKLTYPNGSVFEGVFNKGSLSKGILKFSNGQVYEGEFLNQNFEGKGKLTLKWGEVHEGMWSYGKLNGDSKIIYTDGTKISGVFINGEINNHGKIKTDQYTYVGQFSGKVPNGTGKFKYKSGISYEGSVKNGKLEGTGTIIYPNGDFYEGDFKDGELTGTGKLVYNDGRIYSGEVLNAKPHGIGELVFKTSSKMQKYVGQFENGEFSGNGEAWFAGCYYSGDWENGKICGKGLLKTQEFQYDGNIKNNKFDGFGFLNIAGGHYSGNWVQGKIEGSGEIQDPDKNVFNGMFLAGQPVIKCKVDKSFIEKLGSIDLYKFF